MSRLAQGGLIDRSRTLGFRFDGRSYTGHPGDTLASALLANGVKLVGRSFKYHRPRGILSAGSEEPNALVELRSGGRREPNTRATTVELFDGLEAVSQNRWPSPGFDVMAVNGLFARFLGAGFYYKTFMWPKAAWERLYEPLIRRAAGLGRAAEEADPDHYEKANAFCDVLVIGAGPAGLMAALAAGRAGARVILADEDFLPGGRLNAERQEVRGEPGADFAARIAAELAGLPNVRLMRRTTVFGVYDGGTYGALERVADHLPEPAAFQPRQRLWRIVAKRAVLAAGATERPLVFPGNDRPGVMLAGAVRTYVNRYGVAPGKKVAVFVNHDEGWRTAFDLQKAGIEVVAIVDPRREAWFGAEARWLGMQTLSPASVDAASGQTLRSIAIETGDKRGKIAADALAMSGGWSPNIQLACHHGGRPVWDETRAAFLAKNAPPGMTIAGSAAGYGSLASCLANGEAAGAAAAGDLGFATHRLELTIPVEEDIDDGPWSVAPFSCRPASRGKAFVDFQNDVTADDVGIAHREGFRAVELLKRYTTLGMATDQGRTSSLPGLALMAELTGAGIAATGTTMFRPPYTPVAIGALAGHHRGKDFRPTRLTPTHEWAAAQGAVFVETGPWLRAQYFSKPGESGWQQSVDREVTSVRSGVGLIDVSTFGKIDLQGPDVGALLDRIYINTFSTLAVGKARYGVMLREDGHVMDDGTTARLAPGHFVMTTTTANAVRVYQHLEFALQVLWPELDVQMVSVSEQWAQIAIAGPRSREVLRAVVDADFEVGDAALPYMGCMAASVMGGVPARLFRLSFSGELGYEIAVPARHGTALVEALMAVGAPFGITPYGTEALGVMRIEKGHVSGNELSGQTTAADIGLGRMASTKKDYIGRVMAARPGLVDPERSVLAGFRPVDPAARLRAGAHFLPVGVPADIAHDEGYMTSVAHSPNLGHWIGLGLIRRGPERIGERVRAYDPVRGGDVEVEICAPCFLDPEGRRLRG